VWQFDPRGTQPDRSICNTGNEVPALEDTGLVPHYLPGQNPERDYMVRTYNIPEEAAMGHAHMLYPEYRKTLRTTYKPPASCQRYLRVDRASGAAGRRSEPHLQRQRFPQKPRGRERQRPVVHTRYSRGST